MTYQPMGLPPGVVRGATAKQTPGRYWDANLVRWRQGIMQPIGGWERLTKNPLGSVPRTLNGWTDLGDAKFTGVMCDAHVYALQADQVYDITPTGFIVAEQNLQQGGYGTWDYGEEDFGDGREAGTPASMLRPAWNTMDAWGTQLLFCSSTDGKIYKYDPATPSVKATVVSENAPTSCRGIIVTPERFVLAIGTGLPATDAGNPRSIAWCDQENYDKWSIDLDGSQAGDLPLDTNGRLFTAIGVREGTLVFSDSGDIFLVNYVGQPYIYGSTKVASNDSIMSPYSLATFNGKAIWLTRSGFEMWDGGYVKPVASDLSEYLLRNIDPFWGRLRTHIVVNNVYPEVWVFYPSKGSRECDSFVIYSYEEGWWSMGKMSRSAGIPALVERFPLMAGPDKHLYFHETERTAFTSPDVGEIYAETGAIFPTKSGMTTVTSVLPDTTSAGSTKWTFYGKLAPDAEGVETKYGPYSPRPDGKIDCRFTTRGMRIRVSQAKDGFWSVGEPEYEFKTRGGR